ncbi:hypothetical protein BLOT_003741 [Blomia tropicalis]|nr:hypothetical protein BLOT_003741 [Blomia tropicalis]
MKKKKKKKNKNPVQQYEEWGKGKDWETERSGKGNGESQHYGIRMFAYINRNMSPGDWGNGSVPYQSMTALHCRLVITLWCHLFICITSNGEYGRN